MSAATGLEKSVADNEGDKNLPKCIRIGPLAIVTIILLLINVMNATQKSLVLVKPREDMNYLNYHHDISELLLKVV